VIHATTHTGAERALHDKAIPTRRIGPRAFAALIGVELLLIVGVLVWALVALMPPATPLAAPAEIAPVEAAIRARIGGAVDDPLVLVPSGQSARASNLRGFSLGGQTYYYYVEGAENFDPLSRGAVSRSEVEILLRDDSGHRPFVIYRIV
jgi:hypothetical protein